MVIGVEGKIEGWGVRMSDNTDINLWQILLAGCASFLGGLGLYHNKKISDLSEKYSLKTDCQNQKLDIKTDLIRLEDKMTEGFNRLQDSLEKQYLLRGDRRHIDGK